jgi:hypothetical protein
VKDIRDKAAMLEAAMRIAGNTEAEMRCWEIRRRAEAKAAKLYDAQEKAKRGPDKETGARSQTSDGPTSAPKTLAEHGVTKQEMSEWRELAKVPQQQFDATLAQAVAEGNKPSVDEIAGKKPIERSPNSTIALWVWGRVLDFERNGTLRANDIKPFAASWPLLWPPRRTYGGLLQEGGL